MLKQQLIIKVRDIILKYARPERIYLYGSQVNGEAKEGSDIDIAYDDPEFRKHYLIREEIEKIDTLIRIEVKNIAVTEERFRNRVKSTGKVLYSATKKMRAEDGLYNFSMALGRFVKAVDRKKEIIEEGFEDFYLDLIVKRFEFTFEMSWKALKRYLDFSGFTVKSPRECFREAYAARIIEDEAVWLDMIEQRNLSSHVYDEYQIMEILEKIDEYKNAFLVLKKKLEKGLIEAE